MKTLDEVITALDICTNGKGCENCPYEVYDENGFEEYTGCEKLKTNALHYLREYRRDCENLVEASKRLMRKEHELAVADKNNPLTWDELKQMEGRPVWVEEPYLFCNEWHGYWEVISSFCEDEYVDDPDPIVYMTDEETRHKNTLGISWQAYRKERK